MRRRLLAVTGTLVLLAGGVAVGAGPASAAENIVATSVALSPDGADYAAADLDIGMDATATDTETGLVSNLAGEILGEFEGPGDWDGFDGVAEGYGQSISPAQAEGTVVGSYASIGRPLSSNCPVEWFVLYRCSNSGANVVLLSCFGDLGTCPTTAEEGAAAAFGATVFPTEVEPGGTLTVAGEGCVYPLAGAVLLAMARASA